MSATRRRGARAAAATGLALLAACGDRGGAAAPAAVAAAAPSSEATTPPPVVEHPASFGLGRAATREEIRAWDIDVNPTGEALPAGRGTYEQGKQIYATQCAGCHGARGEGIPPHYPMLVSAEPRDFSFADDFRKTKTIGNYWPYATTLYDYIARAMPLTAPGSLTPDQVYAVVAYLLAENEVTGRDVVMDRAALLAVKMPGAGRFVPDDRTGGPEFR